jgi:aspartyl-tRNA(Asn)/glutamyl-tRNA(Gln) amidotransferase subunit C
MCYRARLTKHANFRLVVALLDNDIIRLARLAQLALDPTDRAKALRDLDRIIAMIDAMQAVDTDGVEPLAHPLEATQRLRDDVVARAIDRERYQSIAPLPQHGLYLVPRVLE